MKHDQEYFDRLLRRGRFNSRAILQASDAELQDIIRDCRKGQRVAPTVDVSDELVTLEEKAKDILLSRHPLQNAGQEGLVK